MAAAYGWPPAVISDLDLDDLETWAQFAEARLKTRPTCPWLTRG